MDSDDHGSKNAGPQQFLTAIHRAGGRFFEHMGLVRVFVGGHQLIDNGYQQHPAEKGDDIDPDPHFLAQIENQQPARFK